MVCIHCGAETQVINSRHQKRNNNVWRRRKCLACQGVFTTEEAASISAAWLVTGPKGAIGPFSRDKLFLSLHKSLEHRKQPVSDAAALTDTVINKLRHGISDGSISSTSIKQAVIVALHRFDPVASTHYQAFHP